jgi:hypothetical protein
LSLGGLKHFAAAAPGVETPGLYSVGAHGFRTFDAIKLALYHQLGKLPESNFTHEFC